MDVLTLIGTWLEAAKMDAVRARSGAEALSLLEDDTDIDVVVTDHKMPGMSGAEFLAVARRIRRMIPALVITGHPDFDGADELPSDVAVMLKPFRRREFISRVQSLLNASRIRAGDQ